MTDHTTRPPSKVDVGTLPDLRVMEDAGPERLHNIIVGVFYMVLEDALMFPPHAASQL